MAVVFVSGESDVAVYRKLHRSFVGSRPLSRATPLPQDDNFIGAIYTNET
jgi:hypothetical protein